MHGWMEWCMEGTAWRGLTLRSHIQCETISKGHTFSSCIPVLPDKQHEAWCIWQEGQDEKGCGSWNCLQQDQVRPQWFCPYNTKKHNHHCFINGIYVCFGHSRVHWSGSQMLIILDIKFRPSSSTSEHMKQYVPIAFTFLTLTHITPI